MCIINVIVSKVSQRTCSTNYSERVAKVYELKHIMMNKPLDITHVHTMSLIL